MIKWITKEQAKKAGKGTQLEAAQSSWERWNQGATCTYEELREGVLSREAVFSGDECSDYCSLCRYKDENKKVLCRTNCIGNSNGCSCEFYEVGGAFDVFRQDTSRHNCDLFQTKAKALCEVIKKFMDGLEEKKPELRHGDYGYNSDDANAPVIQLRNGSDKKYVHAYGSGVMENLAANRPGAGMHTVLGNIFDDLKRIAEDLRILKYKGRQIGEIKIELENDDNVYFHICGSNQGFVLDEAQEIHQKLGQIIATALRDERKGK